MHIGCIGLNGVMMTKKEIEKCKNSLHAYIIYVYII